jgi:hypothetical protein
VALPFFLRGSGYSILALILLWPARGAFAQAPKPATPAASEEDAPLIKGPANQPAIPVQRARAVAGTLVFVHGPTGSIGSQFTRVMVSALPGPAGAPADLSYDKFLGPMTMKSLDQVMRATVAMQHGWPQGQKLQITFSDKPSPSELNPATLAAALALDSMLRNYDIDPSYAAIGWIQEDGSVEPVGSIPERMLGASRAQVARVVVPEKNYEQLSDYLLSQGMGAFVSTQVFTVKNFNEAGVLAVKNLDPNVGDAIKLFGSLQKTLAFNQGNVAFLRTEGTQTLLKTVLAAAPNHASAQILLDWGTGKKATMSFDGSVDVIDRRAAMIIRAFRAKTQDALKTKREDAAQEVATIRFVYERLEPRARPYAAALWRFGDLLQKNLGTGTSKTPPKISAQTEAALTAARTVAEDEWAKLAKVRQDIAEQKQNEKKEEAK